MKKVKSRSNSAGVGDETSELQDKVNYLMWLNNKLRMSLRNVHTLQQHKQQLTKQVCSTGYQRCCEAPTVPNGVGVQPDTHPNALGKRWGNYLYISIQKCPVYADKLRASPSVLHKIGVNWR